MDFFDYEQIKKGEHPKQGTIILQYKDRVG